VSVLALSDVTMVVFGASLCGECCVFVCPVYYGPGHFSVGALVLIFSSCMSQEPYKSLDPFFLFCPRQIVKSGIGQYSSYRFYYSALIGQNMFILQADARQPPGSTVQL
jgi:hypothetical protein